MNSQAKSYDDQNRLMKDFLSISRIFLDNNVAMNNQHIGPSNSMSYIPQNMSPMMTMDGQYANGNGQYES